MTALLKSPRGAHSPCASWDPCYPLMGTRSTRIFLRPQLSQVWILSPPACLLAFVVKGKKNMLFGANI